MNQYKSSIPEHLDVGPAYVLPRQNPETELAAPPAEGTDEYWANLVEARAGFNIGTVIQTAAK